MRKLALILWALLYLPTLAFAQPTQKICVNNLIVPNSCIPVDSNNPFPITGTFSITLQTFGATFPATGLAVGFTDGTNLVSGRVGAVSNVAAATNYIDVLGICQYNSSAPTLTDTRYNQCQLDVNGNLKINAISSALPTGAATSSNQATMITSLSTIATNTGAAIPAGTALIGKVGIDQTTPGTTNAVSIAQIAGTTIVNGGVAGSQSIGGTVATNVAITANPINLGAQAVSSENTGVTTARQVQLVADLVGKLIVLPYSNPENFVSGTTAAMTGTTSTSLVASPGGSLRNYITQISCVNSHATVGTFVTIQDGSGGTALATLAAAAVYGGETVSFPTPLRQPTVATALFVANVTTGANVICSASGYKGV